MPKRSSSVFGGPRAAQLRFPGAREPSPLLSRSMFLRLRARLSGLGSLRCRLLSLLFCGLPLEELCLGSSVGLSEGGSSSDSLVDLIGDVQVLSHRRLQVPFPSLQFGHCFDEQLQSARAQTTSLNEGLFGALQVSVVAAAEADYCLLDLNLQRSEHLAVGPHDFEHVVVFLLRHDGGASHEVVREPKEAALLLREHHHVRGKAGRQDHREAHRLQGNVLEHASTQPTIHRVLLHLCEVQQLSGFCPI
mmetsp:Transcript_41826/g.63220  ORF Transcript_41826/g.63220 Transcript_41826/m.63220 type:complete len:248 (+) Transcript_41826:248-991(+)